MARPKKLSDSELLDIAFTIISHEGFESFTLAQVAKAAKLSPAALLKRFKSKKILAKLARDRKWEVNLSSMNESSLEELSGLEGVFRFLYLISRSVDSKRLGEHLCFLGSEAGNPRSRKEVAGYFETTRNILRRLLRQAIAKNELARTMDPDDFAITLEALIQGSIFQFAFAGGRTIESHLKGRVLSLLDPYLLVTVEPSGAPGFK